MEENLNSVVLCDNLIKWLQTLNLTAKHGNPSGILLVTYISLYKVVHTVVSQQSESNIMHPDCEMTAKWLISSHCSCSY